MSEQTKYITESDSVTIRDWDANAEARLGELHENADPSYRALTNRVLMELGDYVSPGSRVLDAGCGVGFITQSLHKSGYKVTGIDPSPKSVELARTAHADIEKLFLNSSMHDFSEDPRNEAAFDAVVANMTLHSVEHLQTFFAAVSKVLDRHGIFYVTIPNPKTYLQGRRDVDTADLDFSRSQKVRIPFQIRNHKPHPSRVDYYHYPLKTYSYMAESAGLRIADLDVPEQIGPGRPRDIMVIIFTKFSRSS